MRTSLARERLFFTGYDNLTPMALSQKKANGCQAYMKARSEKGTLLLSVSLQTPFGEVSRTFAFTQDTCFRWEPIPGFKLIFILTQVQQAAGKFRFRSWIQARFDSLAWAPVWASFNHQVSHDQPEYATCPNPVCYPGLPPALVEPGLKTASFPKKKLPYKALLQPSEN